MHIGLSRIGLCVLIVLAGAGLSCCSLVAPSNAMATCQPDASGSCSEIDGFPVGSFDQDCGSDGSGCGDISELARLALDKRLPDHAPVIGVGRFDVDMARVCGPVVCAFSGSRAIVVFRLADGSRHAAGYECPGVATCRGTLTWNGYADGVEQKP